MPVRTIQFGSTWQSQEKDDQIYLFFISEIILETFIPVRLSQDDSVLVQLFWV